MSDITALMSNYGRKCATIAIITVTALLATILHMFVPLLGGTFFAVVSIILLLSAAVYIGSTGVQLFRDIKGGIGKEHTAARRGLERNAALSCVLAAVLSCIVIVVAFRIFQ